MKPFETINEKAVGTARVLLVCDHASAALPEAEWDERVTDFIDNPDHLQEHIGVDIGAADVTRVMAEALACPAILANYSRLYVDVNRPPGDFTSMRAIADGVVINGNRNLTEAEKQQRHDSIFTPYHAKIDEMRAAAGDGLAVIFVHSFTPIYKGFARPWHLGILSDADKRLSQPFLEHWRQRHGDTVIGDNEPYSGEAHYSYSIGRHGSAPGLLNFGLEIRQDLIDSADKAAEWAGRVADTLKFCLK